MTIRERREKMQRPRSTELLPIDCNAPMRGTETTRLTERFTLIREKDMTAGDATIFIVDDEEGIRRSIQRLLTAHGYQVRAFESGHHFLLEHDPLVLGCVLLDLALPGMTGLQVQDALRDAGIERPLIFITGQGDVPSSVRALKRGAVDFIGKPVAEAELLEAIGVALELDAALREKRTTILQVQQRVASLTQREREVFVRVVSGRMNKQIAGELGTQERTIKVHRARVMRKMGVRTLADLVHVASRVGIGTSRPAAERSSALAASPAARI